LAGEPKGDAGVARRGMARDTDGPFDQLHPVSSFERPPWKGRDEAQQRRNQQ